MNTWNAKPIYVYEICVGFGFTIYIHRDEFVRWVSIHGAPNNTPHRRSIMLLLPSKWLLRSRTNGMQSALKIIIYCVLYQCVSVGFYLIKMIFCLPRIEQTSTWALEIKYMMKLTWNLFCYGNRLWKILLCFRKLIAHITTQVALFVFAFSEKKTPQQSMLLEPVIWCHIWCYNRIYHSIDCCNINTYALNMTSAYNNFAIKWQPLVLRNLHETKLFR